MHRSPSPSPQNLSFLPPDPLTRYRFSVFMRVLAGTVGVYAASAYGAALLGSTLTALGLSRADAVLGATFLAFVVQAIAVLWVFACRSTLRACMVVTLLTGAMALVVHFFLPAAGGAA